MTPRRPVLRYHGGKWRIASWIISFFPAHRIYVEPFGGAGSVLMRKERCYAEVYNDLDDDVVAVFRVLRDPVKAAELERRIRLTPWSRVEFYASYEEPHDDIDRARMVVVRSFMSFGSTSRRKNRTGFRAKAYRERVPAMADWSTWPEEIRCFVDRLRAVCIENQPALKVIEQQDSRDTLFYVDPPYPIETRTSVKCESDQDRAYAHDLTTDDHRQLAAALRACKGMVVVSGYACDLYDRELYAGWERHEKEALADGARPRTEVVWLNPACSAALRAVNTQQEMLV